MAMGTLKWWFCLSSYVVAQAGVIANFWQPGLRSATMVAMGFHGMCMVFGLFTHLSTFKADLDDKSVELSDEPQK